MMVKKWYELPLDRRAPRGGEEGLNGREYRGGEILPFYVPRIEMPQIDETKYSEFLEFLRGQNVGISFVRKDPNDFRNHQRVLIDKKRLMNINPLDLEKAVLVSADSFIVDGNHRWFLKRERKEEISAYVIGLPFGKAVAAAFAFPGVTVEDGEK